MSELFGTVVRGIKAPIIKQGDDLVSIVTDTVCNAVEKGGLALKPRDVVAVTEAVVARAQGNYASIDQIASDVRSKFPGGTFAVVHPIQSRNRFAIVLRGLARGAKHIYLTLSYPSDEVGNHLITPEQLDASGVNPYTDVLTEQRFRELFGHNLHVFTGVDYIDYYKSIIEGEGAQVTVIFANNPVAVLEYTKHVLCADIHTRERTASMLRTAGAINAYTLSDVLSASVDGSGYNPDFGVLGSNKATEDGVKLFPINCDAFVSAVQAAIAVRTGVTIEVLVYGDGAFKDPVGRIWELADPVVSPAYTSGLAGEPNELKIKYLADNDFAGLSGQELQDAIKEHIKQKPQGLKGSMATQGTTPRRYTDLIGSLCDLTSGSGDKGTPIVLIQGYFYNYTD